MSESYVIFKQKLIAILDRAKNIEDKKARKKANQLIKENETKLGEYLYLAFINNELSLWHQLAELINNQYDNEIPLGRLYSV